MTQTKKEMALYVTGFVLAGALHSADRIVSGSLNSLTAADSAIPGFLSTVLFTLNLAVYCAMLVWWIQSVHRRLLPSGARSCILAAGVMMVLLLLIRSVKYRLTETGTLFEHVCWYAYYVPLAGIPALFLATCLGMEPERRVRVRLMRWTLLAAGTVTVLVLTNDLHMLMFRPMGGKVQWASYTVGPLWYGFYAYLIVNILLGLWLLALADRRAHSGRKTLLPALLLLGMLGLMTLNQADLPAPWTFPEAAVFCMLGIFESCIRSHLIPFNENYIEYFARMRLPAEITDPAQRPVFRTASPIQADAEARTAALTSPPLLAGDQRLYGRSIPAGYAFWTSDERAILALNRELAEANEVLETENDLIRFEAEQTQERLHVDARNRLYAEADAAVQGTQRKIAALIGKLDPADPGYAGTLARILLLNAYIKRKTNFVLQMAERNTVTANELTLALEESARFLSLCGVDSSAERRTARDFTNAEACALYDSFELLAEALVERAKNLLVLLEDGGLRLTADCALPFSLPELPAAAEFSTEDGLLYLTLRLRKGGAA